MGSTTTWWWPVGFGFWPSQAPADTSVANFVALFRLQGYEPCSDGALEEGFQKLALYAIDDQVQHAARQLPNGRWTSKIGDFEDIEHASPGELEGEAYGAVAQFLRRPQAG